MPRFCAACDHRSDAVLRNSLKFADVIRRMLHFNNTSLGHEESKGIVAADFVCAVCTHIFNYIAACIVVRAERASVESACLRSVLPRPACAFDQSG